MEERICYIVGAAACNKLDFSPRAGDYVIAADGGFTRLEEAGINPDLVIGDLDTLGFQPEHPNVITLNTEKDDTDTFAAARAGIELGFRLFHIYCSTGGRLDHTLANIQLLAYLAERKMQGFLFDADRVVTAIANSSLSLPPQPEGYVSVFAHSQTASGVDITGLKYPLDNATLTNTFPLGVSNEFIGQAGTISVAAGTLIITFPRACL
ncbi:MAG: thiamine diphosphokinase [Firmicutes bacterium]|nr:thiamine diphosphokinase [Bacillota bacterium]